MPPGLFLKRNRCTCVVLLLVAVGSAVSFACSKTPPRNAAVVAATEPSVKETTEVAESPQKSVTAPEQAPPKPADDLPPDPYPKKIPAPPLDGGIEWLNTAGPIKLESLRGKVVLLDFWTYCCINCIHVLPDLKKLEGKYAEQLVVIGVHSAKFITERDSQNIREAILRYEIEHPVVNDAHMIIWQHYGVNAWPTLWLIDPEGNAVGSISGEGVFDALDLAIGRLVKYHRAKGTLNETPVHFELERFRAPATPLRFPGKVLADADGNRLFISDSNHNRIVITDLSGKLMDVVGTGEIGRDDGPYDKAKFFRPQGMALDGDTLYVADTENHMVRAVDLESRTVSTISGTGEQGRSRSHLPMPAKETMLNSPWDLWVHEGKLYIAMAGPHQIWVWDAATDEIHAFAGSGREDIEDGEAQFAALAQPSGLASDGQNLFVADSEVSGIRTVSLDNGAVGTLVGKGLFEFGDVDGPRDEVRLQHPLGVAWRDGVLYIADTYNNKIKAMDPATGSTTTFVGDGEPGNSDDPPQFDEPAGLSIAGDKLYVADTNNHAIRVIDLNSKKLTTLELAGVTAPQAKVPDTRPAFPNAKRIQVTEQSVAADTPIELKVELKLAEGYELNDIAPMSYLVEVNGSSILQGVSGKEERLEEPQATFTIPVKVGSGGSKGTVKVSLTYYQCRKGSSGICEVHSVIWEIPVFAQADGAKHVDLVAEGADGTPSAANDAPLRSEP